MCHLSPMILTSSIRNLDMDDTFDKKSPKLQPKFMDLDDTDKLEGCQCNAATIQNNSIACLINKFNHGIWFYFRAKIRDCITFNITFCHICGQQIKHVNIFQEKCYYYFLSYLWPRANRQNMLIHLGAMEAQYTVQAKSRKLLFLSDCIQLLIM